MKKFINIAIVGFLTSLVMSTAFADDKAKNEACLGRKMDLAKEVASASMGTEVSVLNLYTDVEAKQMHFDATKIIASKNELTTETEVDSDDALGMIFISRVRNDVHEGFEVSPLSVVSTAGDVLYTIESEQFDAPEKLESTTPYVISFEGMQTGQEIDYVSVVSQSLYTTAWNAINASEIDMCAYLIVSE